MITTLETRDGAPWRADWAPRALPWIVAANGVSTLLSALLVHLPERLALLRGILPLEVQSGSRTLSVVTGFLLILLARGLARRKRQAWLATLALLTVSAAAHVLEGLNVEEAGLALLLALLLWALRADYQARSDPPSMLRGYVALVAGLLLAFAYSYSGLFLLHDQFSTPHTWSGVAMRPCPW